MATTAAQSAVGGNANTNGRGPFGTAALLDKKGIASLRTSTPNSEAVDSSEDEQQMPASMSMSLQSIKSASAAPVAQRRPSWITEVQRSSAQAKERKFSLSAVSHTSSGSQPTTPMHENGPWDSAPASASRTTTSSANMWSNPQVWLKDRPSRLSEVMPSPTASYHDDLQSPTSMRPPGLPFDIPLEPNRKTVRSQSYSAGQLEKLPGMEHLQQQQPQSQYGRMRSVAHRPSRPSMLGDGSRDMLGALREDEDDVEDSSGSDHGYPLHHTTSLQNPSRLATYGANAKAPSPLPHGGYKLHSRSGTFPLSPGSDYAVADEAEEAQDGFSDLGRAMARNVIGGSTTSSGSNAAALASRSKWQSQLGFGPLEEGNQSRRHSFAAEHLSNRSVQNHMPIPPTDLNQQLHSAFAGYNSMNSPFSSRGEQQDHAQQLSVAEQRKYSDFTLSDKKTDDDHDPIFNTLAKVEHEQERKTKIIHHVDKRYAASYFHGTENYRRSVQDTADGYNPFALPNVFSRPQRILYLVVFKCSRADIYYIPENTGLQVKTGDTVIVEGDRGQDLGTVEAINITMEMAKKLKEDYLRKQYKCLMMFSRMYPHIAVIANDDAQFEQAIVASKAMQASGVHGGQPQQETEPRPKMIKRVARPDEVHLLREKEGNEAKAKRVCQTKVNDHGLRMEILDAEFQHDYRKLTFFYYAEEYINFNDLVTDLFKVYKTRIWMSAINPASFTGAGNPHTGQRAQQWPRQGTQGTFLRTSDNQFAGETARTHSPLEYDTPAARGNREYERLYGNTGFNGAAVSTHGNGRDAAHSIHPDFAQPMSPVYANAGGAPAFSPGASQFAPFANQFGNMATPWNGLPSPLAQQYQQYADPSINYSLAPQMMGTNGPPAQTPAFTPRGSNMLGQNRGQTTAGAAQSERELNALSEQFRHFQMNQRPQ